MIGIVILNYKTMFETEKCIDTIKNSCTTPVHFYVIDNDSQDGSYEYLNNLYANSPDATVINTGKNGGYSFGNNVGIITALKDSCDKIVICNSDVVVYTDVIENLSEALETHKEIGIISPKVINEDDTIMRQLRPAYNYAIYKSEEELLCKSNYYLNPDDDKITIFEGKVCGCFFMLRSEAIEKCNFLDERFFLYYEEDVLAYKMIEAQYKAAYLPTVKVKHLGGVSINKSSTWFSRYNANLSQFKILKYYTKIDNYKLRMVYFRMIIKFIILGIKNPIYFKKIKPFKKEIASILKEEVI